MNELNIRDNFLKIIMDDNNFHYYYNKKEIKEKIILFYIDHENITHTIKFNENSINIDKIIDDLNNENYKFKRNNINFYYEIDFNNIGIYNEIKTIFNINMNEYNINLHKYGIKICNKNKIYEYTFNNDNKYANKIMELIIFPLCISNNYILSINYKDVYKRINILPENNMLNWVLIDTKCKHKFNKVPDGYYIALKYHIYLEKNKIQYNKPYIKDYNLYNLMRKIKETYKYKKIGFFLKNKYNNLIEINNTNYANELRGIDLMLLQICILLDIRVEFKGVIQLDITEFMEKDNQNNKYEKFCNYININKNLNEFLEEIKILNPNNTYNISEFYIYLIKDNLKIISNNNYIYDIYSEVNYFINNDFKYDHDILWINNPNANNEVVSNSCITFDGKPDTFNYITFAALIINF